MLQVFLLAVESASEHLISFEDGIIMAKLCSHGIGQLDQLDCYQKKGAVKRSLGSERHIKVE